jgi:catechol 2,3-dioxygenase-like lactoylglutathione lyase family enzyme
VLDRCSLVAFIATANPEEARAFYEEVLGLKLKEDSPFAYVFDANGVTLRLQKLKSYTPVANTSLGWQVSGIQDLVTEMVRKGIAFERYDGLLQDEQGIWSAPGGAQVAWFKDPDGNVLSLTES